MTVSPARTLIGATTANLVVPIASLATGPLLARCLGVEGRGAYAAITVPIYLAGIIGTLGLQDAITRHVATGVRGRLSSLKFVLVASIPFSIVTDAFLLAISSVLIPNWGLRRLFLLMVICTAPNILANLIIGWATGVGDLRIVNRIKVASALGRLVALVSLAAVGWLTVLSAAVVQNLVVVLGLMVVLPQVRRAVLTGSFPRESVPRLPASKLWILALQLWPGVLASTSAARIDQLVGLPLIGVRQLGLYAAAVSLAELPLILVSAVRLLFLGSASPQASPQDAVMMRSTMLLVGAAALCTAIFAPWLVRILLGGEFSGAVIPVMIVALGAVPQAGLSLLGAALIRAHSPTWQSAGLVGAVAVDVLLLFVMAPEGANGAALAATVSYCVGLGIHVVGLRYKAESGFRARWLLPDVASARLVAGSIKHVLLRTERG